MCSLIKEMHVVHHYEQCPGNEASEGYFELFKKCDLNDPIIFKQWIHNGHDTLDISFEHWGLHSRTCNEDISK